MSMWVSQFSQCTTESAIVTLSPWCSIL